MHCFHFSTPLKSHLLRSTASSSHCQAAGCWDWVNCLHQDVTPQPEKDLETIPGMDVSADYCLKTLWYLLYASESARIESSSLGKNSRGISINTSFMKCFILRALKGTADNSVKNIGVDALSWKRFRSVEHLYEWRAVWCAFSSFPFH